MSAAPPPAAPGAGADASAGPACDAGPDAGAGADLVGLADLVELVVGDPAAGGGCVARAPDGRVVFVRHSLPGERVVARVTAETAHYLRADAVEVRTASPERVAPPCPAAGPGGCGGCDYQHVALDAQRRLKGRLVEVQLERLGGLRRQVEVEALPGSPDGLGWRTRVRFAADRAGNLGLHRHRSHELVPLGSCPLAAPEVAALDVVGRRWPGARHVEVLAVDTPDAPSALVTVDAPRPLPRSTLPRLGAGVGLTVAGRSRHGAGHVVATAGGRRYVVSAGAFWQVHRAAADALVAAVLDLLDPRPGEHVADLYAGVGLFSVPLGAAVGPRGKVIAVERHRAASADLVTNTALLPAVEVRVGAVEPSSVLDGDRLDLVVLDPPRAGAGTAVMAALDARRPRAVAYVACDPASFARDARVLLHAGWSLAALRAFDAFPMTEHVELVALLVPPGALHEAGR